MSSQARFPMPRQSFCTPDAENVYHAKPAHDIWALQAALNVIVYLLLTDGVPFMDLFIVLV